MFSRYVEVVPELSREIKGEIPPRGHNKIYSSVKKRYGVLPQSVLLISVLMNYLFGSLISDFAKKEIYYRAIYDIITRKPWLFIIHQSRCNLKILIKIIPVEDEIQIV